MGLKTAAFASAAAANSVPPRTKTPTTTTTTTSTTTTTTTNTTNTTTILEQWMSSSSSLSASSSNDSNTNSLEWVPAMEAKIATNVYSVAHWISYLEAIDDELATLSQRIPFSSGRQRQQQPTTASTTSHDHEQQQPHQQYHYHQYLCCAARDWVGRRAVSHLPRSYKLWKLVWEFLLRHQHEFNPHQPSAAPAPAPAPLAAEPEKDTATQKKEEENASATSSLSLWTVSAPTIQACFERALCTLSRYPRVWSVYLQWLCSTTTNNHNRLLQWKLPFRRWNTSTNDHTNCFTELRRAVNRALQSVSISQHSKLWNNNNNNESLAERLLSMEFYTANDDTAFQYNNKNKNNVDDDDTENKKTTDIPLFYMPWETAHCLLKRYRLFRSLSTATTGGTNGSNYFGMEYAAWCEKHARWGEAAVAYQAVLNNNNNSADVAAMTTAIPDFVQQQAWQAFTLLVANHADAVEAAGIPWEAILQTAIQQQQNGDPGGRTEGKNSTDSEDIEKLNSSQGETSNTTTMLGLLYAWLASAWIQRGSFDMAVAVYEEGLLHVRTVRDFAVLYAAYLSLTEGLMTALTDSIEEDDMDDDEVVDDSSNTEENDDWDLLLPGQKNNVDGTNSFGTETTTGSKLAEMELAVARAEHLTARRPLLLNAVKLRQNPSDCASWIERADLFVAMEQPRQAATALEDGLTKIRQSGKKSANTTSSLSQVVIRLVSVYVKNLQDVEAARDLLDRVCRRRSTAAGFTQSNDLAECWATWIELELEHEAWDEALSLARQSVAGEPKQLRNKSSDGQERQRLNLTRTLRLWDLLLDLEESLGTVQSTKDSYNRAFEIKVATVQHILNFASFLIERKYFEESLTAYERGIELFAFPHAGAKLLWKSYLTAFLQRYQGEKIERARNLFQRCLDDCPPEECADVFMMYGEFEEKFGLTKRALSVYKAMCDKVTPAEKYVAYQLLILKTIQYQGVAATRDIYQNALEGLKEPSSFVKMCTDFAKMEAELQEIARARAIYTYGSTTADPRRLPEFWKDWNDFEIASGNEDTFREMLRVKRSVEAAFSTINYNAAGMTEQITVLSNDEAMRMIADGEGLDDNVDGGSNTATTTAVAGFVPQQQKRLLSAVDLSAVEERVAKLRKITGGKSSMVNSDDNNNTAVDGTSTAKDDDDDDDDIDEIDLDEIDAVIEQAAAEGGASSSSVDLVVRNVATKAIPDAVFGGLTTQAVP